MNITTGIQRHAVILNQLEERDSVDVQQLCEVLNVSAVTIRKDLKLLEDKGLLFRTHGGASRINPYIRDRNVQEKALLFATEKEKIAAAAANLIVENDSVIIASGTSMVALARAVRPKESLTVITSALNVALELMNSRDVQVIQLCGKIRPSSASVVGQEAVGFLKEVACSKVFLGADGIDLDFGVTTTSLDEAYLNQQMIRSSEETVVLVDSSKFSRRGFGKICGFESVSRIITDRNVSDKVVNRLEEMGVEVTAV